MGRLRQTGGSGKEGHGGEAGGQGWARWSWGQKRASPTGPHGAGPLSWALWSEAPPLSPTMCFQLSVLGEDTVKKDVWGAGCGVTSVCQLLGPPPGCTLCCRPSRVSENLALPIALPTQCSGRPHSLPWLCRTPLPSQLLLTLRNPSPPDSPSPAHHRPPEPDAVPSSPGPSQGSLRSVLTLV